MSVCDWVSLAVSDVCTSQLCAGVPEAALDASERYRLH